MDELVNGNTIVATGNTNIGELNDPKINSMFAQANNPAITGAQRNAIFAQIDKSAMAQAVIMPNVYAKNLFYRPPALTNAYVWSPYGEYNYAVLGVSG
jgi:peptide/nickel transport system substrate-binding protein